MFTLGAVAIGGTLVSGGLGILIFWLTSCRTATGGQTDSYRGTAGRRKMRGYGQK